MRKTAVKVKIETNSTRMHSHLLWKTLEIFSFIRDNWRYRGQILRRGSCGIQFY